MTKIRLFTIIILFVTPLKSVFSGENFLPIPLVHLDSLFSHHVLIAEMPLKVTDKLWQSDQDLIDISWDEIQKCGIVKNKDTFETAKVLKIPKTFAVPKVRYFDYLNEIHQKLKKEYGEKIDFIGQGIFTRHYFVKELLKKFN